jgi:citrate lyase subunit beta/citryl-CoA lyase
MNTTTPLAEARSLLFVPGNRPERFEKARSGADAIILTLEDSVPQADKARARAYRPSIGHGCEC